MVKIRAISMRAAASCAASYHGVADYGYACDVHRMRWYVIYYDMEG